MDKQERLPAELVARYGAAVEQIMGVTDGVRDFRTLTEERMLICLAAAAEILAKDTGQITLSTMREVYATWEQSMLVARDQMADKSSREPLRSGMDG